MTSLSPSRLSSIQAFGTDRLEVAPRHFGTGNVCAIQGRSDAGIRPAHLIILNIYTSKFPNPFIPSRPNIRSLGCYPRGMMLTLPLPQSLAARPTPSILALSNSQLSAPCPHFACELPQQIVQAQVRPSEMTSTTGNAESCFADLRRGGGELCPCFDYAKWICEELLFVLCPGRYSTKTTLRDPFNVSNV